MIPRCVDVILVDVDLKSSDVIAHRLRSLAETQPVIIFERKTAEVSGKKAVAFRIGPVIDVEAFARKTMSAT